LASCSVYDPSLLQSPGNPSDATGDGHGAADGCSEQADPSCLLRCPELCNALDDDCDGASDEAENDELCLLANANSVCVAGRCVVASCENGHVDCDGLAANGCEATLDSNEHCGACNVRCAPQNAEASCTAGRCVLAACASAFGDCDGVASNGCERWLRSVSDCGGCNSACVLPHAQLQCTEDGCGFLRCQPGFGDCNHDAADSTEASDGCETDLSQASDCGACGVQCPEATPFCAGGQCSALRCPDGYANCAGGEDTACATNLRSVASCGACGALCEAPPDVEVMCTSAGECALQCAAGLADCDHAASNGCETDLHSTGNCGTCGAHCSYANATASCSDGNCALVACTAGYGNCNDARDDGCEQPLNVGAHCGACQTACGPLAAAVASCSSGSCRIDRCQSGFGNCDGLATNGCETDVLSSTLHCGACGHACPGTSVCMRGACVCSSDADCPSGHSCCDHECIDTRSDVVNCGGCGKRCLPFTQRCCAGQCNWPWNSCP